MNKLFTAFVIGAAFAAMGCQEQSKPPATPPGPQVAAQPQTPPPGPPGQPGQPGGWAGPPGQGMGPHHMGPPGGPGGPGGPPPGDWQGRHHDGEHGPHHDGTGQHMARRDKGPRGHHGGEGMHGGGDDVHHELAMLGVHFYPPGVILQHTKEINLTADQTQKIRDEVLATKKKSIDLRAKAAHAHVEIVRLLAADKPDEKAIFAQVDEASKAMTEQHKLHIGSMLRVKNVLTPEQRQKLDEHQKSGPHPHGGPGRVSMADDDDDDGDDDGDEG